MNGTESQRKFDAAKEFLIAEIARSFALERPKAEAWAERQMHPARAAATERNDNPGWSFIYRKLIEAAIQQNSLPKVLAMPGGPSASLGNLLHEYDPISLNGWDADRLHQAMCERNVINVKGKARIERAADTKSITVTAWYKLARACVEGAAWLRCYKDSEAFLHAVDYETGGYNAGQIDAQKILGFVKVTMRQHRVHLLGLATLMNFFRSLGFAQFLKPDRHFCDALKIWTGKDYAVTKDGVEAAVTDGIAIANELLIAPDTLDAVIFASSTGALYVLNEELKPLKSRFHDAIRQ